MRLLMLIYLLHARILPLAPGFFSYFYFFANSIKQNKKLLLNINNKTNNRWKQNKFKSLKDINGDNSEINDKYRYVNMYYNCQFFPLI